MSISIQNLINGCVHREADAHHCVFPEKLAKKKELVGHKRGANAGIEPVSTGMVGSVVLVTRLEGSILR